MTTRGKFSLGLVIVPLMALGGALAANAENKETEFNSTIPKFQQSHYLPAQSKELAASSQIRFSFIGSTYLMNVKAQNLQTGTQYLEINGLDEGSTYTIPNATPVNYSTRLIVTNHTWALVNVTAQGWFNLK